MRSLESQGYTTHVFAALETAAASSTAVRHALRQLKVVSVGYEDSPTPALQYNRFALCRDAIIAREQAGRFEFAWVVRCRPDLFYGPLPALRFLDAGAVHSRMRCLGLAAGRAIDAESISTDKQRYFVDILCSFWKDGGCDCRMSTCEHSNSHGSRVPHLVRVDDQFALVPRSSVDAYFRQHNCSGTRCAACLTEHLQASGVRLVQTAFKFTSAPRAHKQPPPLRAQL